MRPISPAEQRTIDASPPVESDLADALSTGRTEGDGRLLERIALPALNVQGLQAGNVGALARNAIPTEAAAAIDFRLVPDQDPARVRALVEAHLRRQGYTIVEDEPDDVTRRKHARLIRVQWSGGTGLSVRRWMRP